MDLILSERNKTLAGYLILLLILLLPFFFIIRTNDLPELNEVSAGIRNRIDEYETRIGEDIDELRSRATDLYKRYRVSVLRHDEMLVDESIVIVKDGVIESYFGEVFYFKLPNIGSGEWKFIKKEDYLYFTEKFEENTYFIKKYKASSDTFGDIKLKFPFISEDTKFYNDPSMENESRVQYDDNIDAFYIYHLSENANDQIYLIIKFSTEDYFAHWKIASGKKFLLIYLLLLIVFVIFVPARMKLIRSSGILVFIVSLFILLHLYSDDSLYLIVFGFEIRSVFIFLYFSILSYLILTFAASKITNEWLLEVFSISSMIVSMGMSTILIRSVNFSYMHFSMEVNYLISVLSMFILFSIPFKILNLTKTVGKGSLILFFISINVLSVFFIGFFLGIPYIVPLILSLSLILNLFYKNNLLLETVKILTISIALFLMVFAFSESEKKKFTSTSLKNIFSNQNNYAKFISRELIHNIHERNENLSEYFNGDKNAELEKVWRRSIALKENISSGIYVISSDREILSSFSYRIPYLTVTAENMFPFWMIDEFKAEYFGRTISVAVASINVFDGYEYLGKIIIQVINSSDLIARDHPESNIFTLDHRIKGDDISYIKLNSKMQVIENPSNIDIRNLNRKTNDGENWIEFDFMDTKFRGYMFDNNEDTLIVFFPRTSFSEISANIIKIFLFLIVLNGLINFRRTFNSELKNFLKTFSFKVFAILILISLFSAITFSLFLIQFNKRNKEIELRREIYNNGGVAYNIISDIIQKNPNLERDHLFFLSKILNTDVTIYQNNRLQDTSNYNKILNSEIPVLISSKVPSLLEDSEKFFIDRRGDSSRIFFNISNYIVRLDFSGIGQDILTRPELFSNFIVNLFFILTVGGILLAFLFRRKILFPINILNNKMSKVGLGELEEIAEIPGETEIKNLFRGFNSMVTGIREQKKNISDIARMKTLIKLSRWIAHEVKNPLTPIKLSAEQILRSLEDKRENYEDLITESIKYIIDETDHLRNISFGFLDISNLDKIDVSKFDIGDLCRNEIFKLRQIYKNINFVFESEEKIPEVRLDKIKITQVLKNLLTNSVESIKGSQGEILLSLGYNDNMIDIRLKDSGSGIDGQVFKKLFDEDFSTKSTGTGLGLFIVKRIIDLHKGSITFDSSTSGTIVNISMPVNNDNEGDNIG